SDRRALQESKAFTRIAKTTLARGGAPSWQALGPVTPNVAGVDSQFFDPSTLTGPPTQESGRVTALAIDPACIIGDCRMWVAAAGTDRSIGAIAVDPTNANTIYIGTDVARHGSSAVNGGRKTPPNAPTLGVYKSTDGGQTFTLEQDLSTKTPPNPATASSGVD